MKVLILLFFACLSASLFSQEADPVQTIRISKEEEEEILLFVDQEALPTFSVPDWISENIIIPTSIRDVSFEGRVYVRFVVEKNGSVSLVEVMRGIPGCPECEAEALRVIKAMPPWRPGIYRGKPVRMYIQIPIKFSLI